jgi:hypothetical protein
MTNLVPSVGSKLKIAANPTNAQQAVVTGATTLDLSGMALSLGLQATTYTSRQFIVLDATNAALNPIVKPFGSVTTNGSNQATVIVEYLDASNAVIPVVAAATPANRVRVTANGAVTPVTMESLIAKAEGAGSLVEWKLASEFQNAGFNVYRRLLGSGGDWSKVNAAMIAGRMTNPSAHTYRFYDWAEAGIYEYRLEHIDLSGNAEFYAHVTTPVAVGDGFDALSLAGLEAASTDLSAEMAAVRGAVLSNEYVKAEEVLSGQAGQEPAIDVMARATRPVPQALLDSTASNGLANSANVRNIVASRGHSPYDVAAVGNTAAARGLNAPNALPRAIARPTSGGTRNAAKLVYSKPGVILLPKSMLPAGMNINQLSIVREGRAQSALALTSAGLYLYGPGYEDDYTNKDAFFLSPTGGATQAGSVLSAQGLFAGGNAAGSTSLSSKTTQFHDVYFDWSLRPYDYPPYFSKQYLTQGGTASFSMAVDYAVEGSTALTVNVWSLTSTDGVPVDHAVQAFVNGTAVGQATWGGGGRFVELTFAVPSNVLHSGDNSIELVTPVLPDVTQQIALVHSIGVNYTKQLSGPGTVDFTHSGSSATLYEVSNMPTSSLWVVDARYPDRAGLVAYESQAQADGSYKVRFTAQAGGTGHYLVVPMGAESAPLSVTKRAVKPLQSGLKYVATGPVQFASPVQSLLMQRNKEGFKCAFVDQEQLFDYYNYGRYGPDGIRNAVRATRPEYLLLAGRTNADYRDYTGTGADPLCPTYLVSTTFWSQATSDSMFGDLGRGYPEVKIGRIPANTAGECSVAVRHILNYKGLPASGWSGHVTADVADIAAGDFAAEAESVINSFPDLSFTRNYVGVTCETAVEATESMAQAASGGAELMFYNGHGNSARLGNNVPRILDAVTVQEWKGNVVFIAATCTFNWVAKNEDGYRSIPIQAMVQPQGGMAASISTTTYMNSTPAIDFTKQLLTQSQNLGSQARWGDVVLRAQQWAYQASSAADGSWYMDLSKTECILGDPAMPVYGKSAPAGTTGHPVTPTAPSTSGNTPGTF